eukprot:12945-Heterococcus_DN1.PRE.2
MVCHLLKWFQCKYCLDLPSKVAVVSPYSAQRFSSDIYAVSAHCMVQCCNYAQVDCLNRYFQGTEKNVHYKFNGLQAYTIDKFSSTADIVIVSLVRANDSGQLGFID